MAVVQLFSTPDFVSGLFAAFPLLPAGLLLLERTDLRRPLVARALLSSCLFVVAVVLTAHAEGGAAEWGGRFLHLLLPILVPVLVLGLAAAGHSVDRRSRTVALVSLIVISLAMSATAARVNVNSRRIAMDSVSSSSSKLADLASESSVNVIPVTLNSAKPGTARLFWQSADEKGYLSARSVREFVRLLALIRANGESEVLLSSDLDAGFFQTFLGSKLRQNGWRPVDQGPTPGGARHLTTFVQVNAPSQ
jgi:hypothetical protein